LNHRGPQRAFMTVVSSALFGTVPRHDYLHFWPNQKFDPQRVTQFLDLTKGDVAKVADVATSSVRFDKKIPKDVMDRLTEIAIVCGLVAQFFDGDVVRTALWFKTKNPLLGNISPRDMIRYGRYEKLQRFVMEALEKNASSPEAVGQLERGQEGEPSRSTQKPSS
jgi:hypothetical protein